MEKVEISARSAPPPRDSFKGAPCSTCSSIAGASCVCVGAAGWVFEESQITWLVRCLRSLRRCQRVALLLHESLLPKSSFIIQEFKQIWLKETAKGVSDTHPGTACHRPFVYLCGDSQAAACCVDAVPALTLQPDVLVRMGPGSCLSQPQLAAPRPVVYIYTRAPIDVTACARTIASRRHANEVASEGVACRTAILLVMDCSYQFALGCLLRHLEERLHRSSAANSRVSSRSTSPCCSVPLTPIASRVFGGETAGILQDKADTPMPCLCQWQDTCMYAALAPAVLLPAEKETDMTEAALRLARQKPFYPTCTQEEISSPLYGRCIGACGELFTSAILCERQCLNSYVEFYMLTDMRRQQLCFLPPVGPTAEDISHSDYRQLQSPPLRIITKDCFLRVAGRVVFQVFWRPCDSFFGFAPVVRVDGEHDTPSLRCSLDRPVQLIFIGAAEAGEGKAEFVRGDGGPCTCGDRDTQGKALQELQAGIEETIPPPLLLRLMLRHGTATPIYTYDPQLTLCLAAIPPSLISKGGWSTLKADFANHVSIHCASSREGCCNRVGHCICGDSLLDEAPRVARQLARQFAALQKSEHATQLSMLLLGQQTPSSLLVHRLLLRLISSKINTLVALKSKSDGDQDDDDQETDEKLTRSISQLRHAFITISVGEATPAKLLNFSDTDGFCLIGCVNCCLTVQQQQRAKGFNGALLLPIDLLISLGLTDWNTARSVETDEVAMLLEKYFKSRPAIEPEVLGGSPMETALQLKCGGELHDYHSIGMLRQHSDRNFKGVLFGDETANYQENPQIIQGRSGVASCYIGEFQPLEKDD